MLKKIAKFMVKYAGWSYLIRLALLVGAFIAFNFGMISLPFYLFIIVANQTVGGAYFALWCIVLYSLITNPDKWEE